MTGVDRDRLDEICLVIAWVDNEIARANDYIELDLRSDSEWRKDDSGWKMAPNNELEVLR